jgi:hypothetical protein
MTLDQLKRIAPLVSVSNSYGKMELVKKICEALNQRGIVEKCKAERGFTKDKNTIPRIVNLCMSVQDRVSRCHSPLASSCSQAS